MATMSLFQGDVRCPLPLGAEQGAVGDAVHWGTSVHGHRCASCLLTSTGKEPGCRLLPAGHPSPRAPHTASLMQSSMGKPIVSRLNTWISGTPTLFKARDGRKPLLCRPSPSLTAGSRSRVPLPPCPTKPPHSWCRTQVHRAGKPKGAEWEHFGGAKLSSPHSLAPCSLLPLAAGCSQPGSCLTHHSKALLLHKGFGVFLWLWSWILLGCKQVQLIGFLLRPDFGP